MVAPSTRSRPKVGIGYQGPIPDELWEVLATAAETPIALASNYARLYSTEVALAASMGWLSTIGPDGLTYSRAWKLTPEGAFALTRRRNGV